MNEKHNTLSSGRLFTIGVIFVAVSIAWVVFGKILTKRNEVSSHDAKVSVKQIWGPDHSQAQPQIWFSKFADSRSRSYLQPESSLVNVKLNYEPKKKGLTWSNTYTADFSADYQIKNTSTDTRVYHINFSLPSANSSYHDFQFLINGKNEEDTTPNMGSVKQLVSIPAGETADIHISYRSRGMDQWAYHLGEVERIRNFQLNMETNFEKIDFPVGSSSPTTREHDTATDTWHLKWNYPDVIRPQNIAMHMPEHKDTGVIAAKVSFFAPFSLLFFFVIMIIFGIIKKINLHPMNYIFLAAGFFSFHLLFAYLVDLVSLHVAFVIAATSSLALISSYVKAVGGKELMKIAIPAQFAYLVLFSYSFLFDGVTGLTIAVGSIITLALVMRATAQVDWSEVFTSELVRQKSKPVSGTPSPTQDT